MAFQTIHEGKRTFNASAQVDLTNGDLVKAMSVNAFSSTQRYEDELEVGSCALAADAVICIGINVGSTTSGNVATIAQDGVYVMDAGDSLVPGNRVACSLDPQAVIPATTTNAGSIIGTALSAAGSTEQVVISLNV